MAGKATIVFVHGAWCDASVWTKVLMPLAHEGFAVRAAQLPLEGFAGDVAAVHRLLEQVEGPVLLVGHSYAGAVITAAGNHDKVKALAYVCAFAPEAGEVFGSLTQMTPRRSSSRFNRMGKGSCGLMRTSRRRRWGMTCIAAC